MVFWKLACETAVHVNNRTPSQRLKWKTPIEMFTGKKPDLSYFRVFGCKAFVLTQKERRQNKLTPKAKVMTFVGYEPGSKGYRFWDSNSRQIVVSRDVTFDERTFPHQKDSLSRVPIASRNETPPPQNNPPHAVDFS